MKKFKQITALVMAATLTLSMGVYYGGSEVKAAEKGKVTSVSVTNLLAKTLTLKKGKTKVLKVSVKTSGKKVSKAITFKSSNKKVVSVSKSGKNVKLKAKKNGKATIIIKSKAAPKKKVAIKVTVGTPAKKITLNQTSASLYKGKSLQLKASVAPKNTSNKKVIWSTSSSNVATVNSKGVVVAKSTGTATIKALAADGSGKAATCKITVSNPIDIKDVAVMNSSVVRVTLTSAQSLQASAFTIKNKYYRNGTYNKVCKIQSIYSTDKINYYIVLDNEEYIEEGSFVHVTVNGLAGNSGARVKEIEYTYTVATYNDYRFIDFEYNEEVNDSMNCNNGMGYMSASWTNLPAGIKAKWNAQESYVEFSGKPTTKGKHTTVFTFKDEIGNVYKENVVFMIYSSNNIVAAAAPEYAVTGSEQKAYVSSSIYVAGGSGEYDYEIVGNTYGLIIEEDEYYDDEAYVEGDLPAGTYNINVKVTDNENTSLTTTCTVTFNVKKGITVKGVVKDLTGNTVKYADIYFDNKNYGDPYGRDCSISTDDKGIFTAVIASGKYDICAYKNSSSSNYLFNQNITDDKSGLVLTINGYKITIGSNNSEVSPEQFDEWYDGEGNYYGYGSETWLKPGTYKLTCKGNLTFMKSYEATVSMTVKGVTSVVANVVTKQCSYNDIALNEVANAHLASDTVYYRFIPEESGTYYFYSIDGADPEATLYDEYGNYLSSSDDYYDRDFSIEYYCEAGQTYYLAVDTYKDSEDTDIMVSDESYYDDDYDYDDYY